MRRPRSHFAVASLLVLAACGARRVPPPPPPPPAAALPAEAPQEDWRDVPLTPGTWSWSGGAGRSLARFGVTGGAAAFAVRCDLATRAVVLSRGGVAAGATSMAITTSFPPAFALAAQAGAGEPPAIVAQASARDPRLDRIAFSRGRFLVDVPGQPRLVLPAWPEVARVIEDCRG